MAGLAAVPSALASSLPMLPSYVGHASKGNLKVKPKSITYFGDGSGFFAGAKGSHNRAKPLDWTSWTATGAKATGYNWVNNCTPSCAAGRFHQVPIKLHAWRPKTEHGHLVFSRLTVTSTSSSSKSQVWKVIYSNGAWSYVMPDDH